MTSAPEIPADVMAAAREAAASLLGGWDYPRHNSKIIARAILAERQRCVDVVKAAPHFIYHSEEEFAETGMIGRQAGRDDLCAAIQGHNT